MTMRRRLAVLALDAVALTANAVLAVADRISRLRRT
jgi:hypothetical protein